LAGQERGKKARTIFEVEALSTMVSKKKLGVSGKGKAANYRIRTPIYIKGKKGKMACVGLRSGLAGFWVSLALKSLFSILADHKERLRIEGIKKRPTLF